MCKRLVVSASILLVVLAGAASAVVVNDTQTWGTTGIENLAGSGLEVGPAGNLTITGRVDMDAGAWIRMSGGTLITADTLKFPDSAGSQNVRTYIDAGTFTAHHIENLGYDRDGIIYIGGGASSAGVPTKKRCSHLVAVTNVTTALGLVLSVPGTR